METSSERSTMDNRSTSTTMLSTGSRGHGCMSETPKPTSRSAGYIATTSCAKATHGVPPTTTGSTDAVGAIEMTCRPSLRDSFEPAFVIATRVAAIIGIVTLIVIIVSVVRVSSAHSEARQISCIGTLVKSKGSMTDRLSADIGSIGKLNRADTAAVPRVCG